MAATVKAVYPQVRIISVEPEDAASMHAALVAGHPVDIGTTGIFSDGVAVRKVGQLTFELCRELVDEVIMVSVDQVCSAVKLIFEEVRATVEPAGALAAAVCPPASASGSTVSSSRSAPAPCSSS